jgi:hypothetical protein
MQMKVESRLTPEARVFSFTISTPVSLAQQVQAIPAAAVCLTVAAFGLVSSWITPHSARIWYDPTLAYMLSSLSWFRGQGYVFVDHPGTPVEVLGTLLLGLSYPALHAANDAFVRHYLLHPQDFLSVAQTLIVCASIGVAWLVARRSVTVRDWRQAIVGAGIAAVYFIVLPEHSLRVLTMWNHESFNFPAGTLLCLAVLIAVRRTGGPSRRSVLALGLASGVLTSVQLYFAAWVVGTAVALGIATRLRGDTWWQASRCAVVVGAMAGLGFLVATLPIHDQYPQFLAWVWSLVTHEGTYGKGAPGIVSPDQMESNLATLVLQATPLFVACGAGAIFLGWRMWLTRHQPANHPVVWAAGVGLAVQLLVLLLMNAKHPGYGSHYLLPLAATLPLVFAATLDGVDLWPKRIQLVLAALGFVTIAVFGRTMRSAIFAYQNESNWIAGIDTATESMLTRLAEERHIPRESLNILWTYGTGSPCFGLWFGDGFTAGRTFDADIAEICPHDRAIGGKVDLADYHDWDVAVLTDGLIAQIDPVTLSPGSQSYASSIDSIRGYGKLVFVTRN